MLAAYKFRIYPTKEQKEIIEKNFEGVRFVYNLLLKERIDLWQNEKKSTNYFTQAKEIKPLRKEHPWLQVTDSTALYSAARNLDTAYQNFYRRVKKGEKPGFPKFKKAEWSNQSYRSYGKIEVGEDYVRLPKLKNVVCRVCKPVQGRILAVTVSRNASDRYFVSLCCDGVEIEPAPSTGKTIELKYGPDLPESVFAVDSNGKEYRMDHSIEDVMPRVRLLQEKLNRQKPGSNRRKQTKILLAKIHEKVTNQRKDALHKLSLSLVREYDRIILEELSLKEIQMSDHEAAKKIRDAAWGEFKWMLQYKAEWYGKEVVIKGGKEKAAAKPKNKR